LEDHLLIMLIYYRCYITQEFLGFFYNVNKSAICRAIKRIEKLVRPLIGVERKPKISREEAEALIVDCTEQPIQRPAAGRETARALLREEEAPHAENRIHHHPEGRIVSASPSHPAVVMTWRSVVMDLNCRTRHDFTPDSAYQGYDKEHRNLEFPYKKPKNGKLNDEEKEYNRGLSGFRVRVEHRIGRTKRFKIASERFRNPLGTHHTKISIIAGLVNLEDGFGPF